MKKWILILAIVMLLAGVGLLLFPKVSNAVGKKIAKEKTEDYEERLEKIVVDKSRQQAIEDGDINEDVEDILFMPDIERLHADSIAYNERIRTAQASLLTSTDAYHDPALDLTDYGIFDGVYAYIRIPKIGMYLPIYLGANGESMSYGAAHLTYTSLPLGGEYSNCVLAGHSGYIGRIFFDDLFELTAGDEVIVRNFWSTLHYRVIKTEIHKPSDAQNIFINDARDLLTMVTCTSDGNGSFNRFHVICERIESERTPSPAEATTPQEKAAPDDAATPDEAKP